MDIQNQMVYFFPEWKEQEVNLSHKIFEVLLLGFFLCPKTSNEMGRSGFHQLQCFQNPEGTGMCMGVMAQSEAAAGHMLLGFQRTQERLWLWGDLSRAQLLTELTRKKRSLKRGRPLSLLVW